MVFSSASDYFDPPPPPNWHQQTNHQQQSGIFSPDQALQIQPPPPAHAGGGGSTGPGSIRPGSMLDRARMARVPLPEPGLKCPRCDSSNTKFCYFNNYNLTQPRHFCKACRRYWTRGGALRNVPVGGGCRRNKRSKRTKSAPAQPTQRNNSDAISSPVTANGNGNGNKNGNGNGNGNSFSSQMFLPPPPQLQYLSSLHPFSGYPGGFGLNLGGGGGAVEFESGAGSSNAVSRAQQLSNLLSGSGVAGNGLYPFRHESATTLELDHGSGFGGQGPRVKAEDNNNNNTSNSNGLSLSKNVMMGIQGNDNGNADADDHYGNWGSGPAWTDISGFNALGTSGYGDRT